MPHNFLNPLKQATAGLSDAPALVPLVKVARGPALTATNLDSQFGFVWESVSPVQVADISDCFITPIARWEWSVGK